MKILLILFVAIITLATMNSCNTAETAEQKEKRLAKRQEYAKRKSNARVSVLPGLSQAELDTINAVDKQYNIEKSGDFIYSAKDEQNIKHPFLNELNEGDQESLRKMKKSNDNSEKNTSNWVFGL